MRRWQAGVLLSLLLLAVLMAWMLYRRATGMRRHTQQGQLAANSTAPSPEVLQWHLATLACGTQVHHDPQGEIVCPVCPQGSDFAGQLTRPGDTSDNAWRSAGVVFGHFTDARADEVILKSRGCESHANGFGGDFLLRQEAGAWRRIRYIQAGQIDNTCQRLRWTGGRDALICQTGDMHQGLAFVGVDLYLVEAAPADPGEGVGTEFLGLSDDEGACLDARRKPEWLQSAQIDGVDLLPRPDGRQDVAVRASIGRIKGVADSDGNCPKAPERPFRVVFRNDGDHFVLAETAEALRALKPMDCCEINLREVVRPYRY